MNNITLRKKEANYHRIISQILSNDLYNKEISDLISVIDVKLSKDNSHLKVFVSFARKEEKLFNELKNKIGHIKKMMSQYEIGRKVPNLIFEIDTVEKNAQKIEDILKSINKEKKDA